MRLKEFADAEEQIKLCKLTRETLGKDITEQANDQEHKPYRCDKFSKESQDRLLCPTQTESVLSTKVAKKKPRPTTGTKPKNVSQPKLPSAQKSVSATKSSKQQQQLPPQAVKPQVLPLAFKNTARSNRATPSQQSSTSQSQTSAKTLQQRPMSQKHDPDSVANTQRQLDGNPPARPKAPEVEFSTKEFLREEVKIYRQPDHGCAQTG